MTDLAAKEKILKDSGYSYNFDRELYLNKSLKKAFSVEFIEERSKTEIEELPRDKPGPTWQFFFISKPSTAVERELANMLG